MQDAPIGENTTLDTRVDVLVLQPLVTYSALMYKLPP